ncbi:MAG: universal stress protein [Saprospiraceae bacterium]|nr:universal stress protein [Saprospiraceae bacterium]MBK8450200.1 universal stress protein [Saprospiraceae bacterium]MBK8483707.1 universal stress protein [Saprospiraceae bacterium]MBK9221159.1 universal stress protein [Saprospiraceae bacterium]MBK9721907.1 universal stress protein [Saprospiraceae bacterium]
MKRILVPIDYSNPSLQAARYAFHFALESGATLDFLHIFSIPVSAVDSYVYVPDHEEIEAIRNNHLNHLNEIASDLRLKSAISIQINVHCVYGHPIEQILEFGKQYKNDLIIIGLQGEGFLKERFVGSITTHLFRKSHIPVIAIHSTTTYSKIKNILFAYDLKPFSNKQLLKPLVELANYFNAHVHVLNVTDELEIFPNISEQLQANHLNPPLNLNNTSYHIVENENIVDGIKEYLAMNTIDLIVIISREHSVITNIFDERISKKTAFNLDLPILAFHD